MKIVKIKKNPLFMDPKMELYMYNMSHWMYNDKQKTLKMPIDIVVKNVPQCWSIHESKTLKLFNDRVKFIFEDSMNKKKANSWVGLCKVSSNNPNRHQFQGKGLNSKTCENILEFFDKNKIDEIKFQMPKGYSRQVTDYESCVYKKVPITFMFEND